MNEKRDYFFLVLIYHLYLFELMAASETEPKDVEKSKYQKPLVFNKLLPYSDCIEDEANEIFKRIKENLSIAVQKRELWPGSLFWTNRLSGYARSYQK